MLKGMVCVLSDKKMFYKKS